MNEYPVASDSPQPVPPPQPVRVSMPAPTPYATYAIICVTVFFFVLQVLSLFVFGRTATGMDVLEVYGALNSSSVHAGQLWRFITPILLHDTTFPFLHILFNMYALYVLGIGIERTFGYKRYLVLYLLSGFSGNVMSFLVSSQHYTYSIGASTAIFGLIGAEGIFLVQNRKLFAGRFGSAIRNVIFVIVLNLFVIGSLPYIDNWGHIGGLLGGLIFTWFAGPVLELEGIQPMIRVVDRREFRDVIVGVAAVILIFGGLAMWGMMR